MDTSSVIVTTSSSLSTTSTTLSSNDPQQNIIQILPETTQIDNQQQQSLINVNNVINDTNNNIGTSFASNIATTTTTTTAVAATASTTNESIIPVSITPVPIKLGGSTQPIFVSNQGIIAAGSSSNVATMPNAFVSYILPAQNSSLQPKTTTVNVTNQSANTTNISETISLPQPTTALLNAPIVINQSTTSDQKLTTSNNNNSTNFKLIQSAAAAAANHQKHLVFSPIKPAIGNVCTNTLLPSKSPITNQKSNQRIIDVKNDSQQQPQFTSPTTILANATQQQQQQQQQLIILSPVKSTGNLTTKTTQMIPSFKILPSSSTSAANIMTTSQQQTSKRALAPVPISKTIVSTITPTNARPIQATTNKNVQYISFVPINSAQQIAATGMNASTVGQATTKFVPIKQSKSSTSSTTTTSTVVKSPILVHGQKVLVNPNTIKISGTATTSSTTKVTTTSTNAKSKNHTSSVWVLPKQPTKGNDNHQESSNKKYVPIAPNPTTNNSTAIENASKNITDSIEETRRKPCNCTRSQCLKLYCDCFANGEFCNGCNCVSCFNNLEHEDSRQKAIRLCLDRNPNAFHPKIGQSNHGDIERRHTKGCCCKRSGCLKNYCECYEAKILCSNKCRCRGCKNYEESDERKTLIHLNDAAFVRSSTQQPTVTSKMHIWDPEFKSKLPVRVKSDCHPFNVLTNDILETTASCLLAQAEEGEFENLKEENIQSLILDQFGECLSQILNLANNVNADDDGNSDDDYPMNDDVDCTN